MTSAHGNVSPRAATLTNVAKHQTLTATTIREKEKMSPWYRALWVITLAYLCVVAMVATTIAHYVQRWGLLEEQADENGTELHEIAVQEV